MNKPKTNMEILNEIRDSRNAELKEIGINDRFVVKVEALGTGENTNKRFFRLIEEKEVLDPKNEQPIKDEKTGEVKKEIWEWYYEYEDSIKVIAVKNPNTKDFSKSGIMPLSLSVDEKEKWNVEREDIEKCIEEREKQIKTIAKELGISEKEIQSLSEIDLSQKVIEKQEEKEDIKETEKNQNEKEPQQLSEENAKKVGMTGLNEVKLNSKVDAKGTTLGQELKLEGYTKLIVVHSYKLAEITDNEGKKGTNTRNKFNLIAQKDDGSYEIIPQTKLYEDKGQNKRIDEINDKENIEEKNEDCIFKIPGTDKSIVISQKDPYGIPDVYLSKNTRNNDGQVAQKLQDKYDGTQRQDIEVRELFNKTKGEFQADKMRDEFYKTKGKNQRTSNNNDKKSSYKNIDGDENTSGTIYKDSLIDFDGIKGARFDILAKSYGNCETLAEIEELLKITNEKVKSDSKTPEEALKLAIEERNNGIIKNSENSKKVEELMESENIKDPKAAIKALESSGWDIDRASENLGKYIAETREKENIT